MKIKVDIISGFLGAGKTTLIKKLIEEKVFTEKIAIIENEFGQVGIDGKLLSGSGIEIKEINSGCICCTLAGDFEKSISELLERFKPDRIIIEPSGVGKLSDVIKACNMPKIQDKLTINSLIVAVDVVRYQLYISNFAEFYENQIKNARTIMLSRTDTVSEDKLKGIVEDIRKINATANIVTTPWTQLLGSQIMALAENKEGISLEKELTVKKLVIKKPLNSNININIHKNNLHDANEVFEVWSIETPQRFDEEKLKLVLEELAQTDIYGMVLRGKGIVQVSDEKWLQFDYVPNEININHSSPDYTGRLCFIGHKLNKKEIERVISTKQGIKQVKQGDRYPV